ncbi:MAG: GlsB/YeaQ/YmgE family stress response membrane protein [Sphingomonadales bacterium]|nr:GlsB/YeaQ/YmgE family stress response membrane protein [Sphingomonadales bacterium]
MQYVIMGLVGLVVGILARFLYPGAVHISWLWSMVLGIAGSYLAGSIGALLHRGSNPDGRAFHPAGFIYSIIGAMVLIFIARNVFHLV